LTNHYLPKIIFLSLDTCVEHKYFPPSLHDVAFGSTKFVNKEFFNYT